jgi:hypothetical protein
LRSNLLFTNEAKERKDTSLYFTVNTPVFPEERKIKLGVARYSDRDDDDESENDQLASGIYRTRNISNDTTGEKIFVSFFHPSRYFYVKDSSSLGTINKVNIAGDSTWMIRSRKKSVFPGNTRVFETVVFRFRKQPYSMIKSFYREGIGVSILTQSDTLSQPSAFVKTFFESFMPVDSFKGVDPLTKKSNLFFSDLMNVDSNIHKRAVKNIDDIKLDSMICRN